MDIEALIAESLNLKSQPKAKAFARKDAVKNQSNHNLGNGNVCSSITTTTNNSHAPIFQPSKKAVHWKENIEKFHELFSQIEPPLNSDDEEFGDFQAIKTNIEPTELCDDFGAFMSIQIPDIDIFSAVSFDSNERANSNNNTKPLHLVSSSPWRPHLALMKNNCAKKHVVQSAMLSSQNGIVKINHKRPENNAILNGRDSRIFLDSNSNIPINLCGGRIQSNIISQMNSDELSTSSFSDIASVQSLEMLPSNLKSNTNLVVGDKMDCLELGQDLTKTPAQRSSQECVGPNYYAIRDEIPCPSYDTWVKILEKCKYHLNSFTTKLKEVDDCAINLLISANPFNNYLNDLLESHVIAHRIEVSFKLSSIQSTSIPLLLDEISSIHNTLCSILTTAHTKFTNWKIFEIPESTFKFASIESTYCRICFLQQPDNHLDQAAHTESKVAWKMIRYLGKDYHLSCLNFWLNCMENEPLPI